MTLHVALAISALAASVLLVASSQQRVLPVIALVAAAVETAVAFGYLHISVSGLPLGLILGLALALPGLVGWLRATAKAPNLRRGARRLHRHPAGRRLRRGAALVGGALGPRERSRARSLTK